MKFEIVEAYEFRKKAKEKFIGWSMHIYFPEFEMDIKGFVLMKLKDGWFLKMPFLKNYSLEEKKFIIYPMISFLETGKTKDLVSRIKEKSISYIEEKIAQEIIEKEKNKKSKNEEKN